MPEVVTLPPEAMQWLEANAPPPAWSIVTVSYAENLKTGERTEATMRGVCLSGPSGPSMLEAKGQFALFHRIHRYSRRRASAARPRKP